MASFDADPEALAKKLRRYPPERGQPSFDAIGVNLALSPSSPGPATSGPAGAGIRNTSWMIPYGTGDWMRMHSLLGITASPSGRRVIVALVDGGVAANDEIKVIGGWSPDGSQTSGVARIRTAT